MIPARAPLGRDDARWDSRQETQGRKTPASRKTAPRRASTAHDFHRTVIVAMIAMGVMQAAIDEIVDVVAMRDRLMATARTMDMAGLMARAGLARRAVIRIGRADLDHMLVDMVPMHVMEVAIVEIVHMVAMADAGMATVRAMLMGMVGVNFAGAGHYGASSV